MGAPQPARGFIPELTGGGDGGSDSSHEREYRRIQCVAVSQLVLQTMFVYNHVFFSFSYLCLWCILVTGETAWATAGARIFLYMLTISWR